MNPSLHTDIHVALTHSHFGHSLLLEDPHVESLALEVLESGDRVDGVALGVHVDGVDGDVVVARVLLNLLVLVIGGWELWVRVPRVGQCTIIVH